MSLDLILYSFLLAVTAFIYVDILTDPEMILGWWWKFTHRLFKSKWILNPLIECEFCVAGQLAVWYYLYFYWYCYDIITHVFFISLTLFWIVLIKKIT